jgi:hypothetical protein
MASRLRPVAGGSLLFLLLAAFAMADDVPPGVELIQPLPPPAIGVAAAPAATAAPAPLPKSAPPTMPDVPPPPTKSVPLGERQLLGAAVHREGKHFEVDAPDNASVQTVLRMAEQLPELMEKFFPWPDQPPSLIQIDLMPAAQAEFTGPFIVTVDKTGHCVALVRWGPEAKFSDVCQAIGQASLESLAVWRDGPEAAARTPDWLALALGKLLEVGLKPALIEELSQQGQALPVLSLRQLMTTSGPYGDAQPVVAINAYWLLRFLDEQSNSPALAEALFSTLASGADPAKALTTAFPDEFENPRDLELWWQIGYREFTGTHATPAQTMAQSRALLDRLEYLNLPDPDGGEKRTRLDEAWAGRADKTVRDTIAQELVTGRSLPVQANPVYRNAVLSLLTALEMLHADDEKKFREAWADYQKDRAVAELIASGVDAALSGTSNIERSTSNAQ